MISPELAAFIESGISVIVGTRDARLRPDCVRGAGVRADPEAGTLSVFLPAATSERALANLADNGRIAVTVTRAMPELLLRPPVPLSRFSGLCLFSLRDVASVRRLGPLPLPIAEYGFPGYTGDLVPAETRRRIEAYFAAPHRAPAPDFEFDRVRPRN